MIEFPSEEIEQSVKRKATYLDVVFGFMLIFAASFSSYTTYIGYSYDFPKILSLAVAVIVGLGLIGTNIAIKQHREDSIGVIKPFVFFFLIFVFSFISNTNAIYTYFLERDIVGQTQEVAWRIFDSETLKIDNDIVNSKIVRDEELRRKSLEVAKRNLYVQITDINNLGLGPEAKEHLSEVVALLGEHLTSLRPPQAGAPIEKWKQYATRLNTLIEDIYARQTASGGLSEVYAFQERIGLLRDLYGDEIEEKNYNSGTTDLMKRDLEQIADTARNLLGYAEPIEKINNTSDEIGSFQYTWTNFINWTSPMAIVLSVLLGGMLDLLTPMMSLLLFRPGEKF